MAVHNTWMPPRPLAQQPAPAMNRSQKPGAAEHLSRQLQSNPAFMKSLSDKFKISASQETGSAKATSGLESAFTSSDHSGDGGEFKLGGDVRLHGKNEVLPKLRKAIPGSLRALAGVGPGLGDAAGSPNVSAQVGEKAGLKGHHKGCGVLGALVKKELGLRNLHDSGRSDTAASSKKTAPNKGPGLFVNHVHGPVMLGPAPAPRAPLDAGRTPQSAGRQVLSDALRTAGGKVGELLQGTDLGKMIKLAEGLPTALAQKATERLKHERFFLAF